MADNIVAECADKSYDGQLLNCTPHDIHVYDKDTKYTHDQDGETALVTFRKSDYVARIGTREQSHMGEIITEGGKTFPVFTPQCFTDVQGLPPCKDGKCVSIIVAMLVGQKLKETGEYNGDVFGPDTNHAAVRNTNGQLVGTTRFVRYCERQDPPVDCP